MKDKEHTVSYRPLEYYSMCSESSKRHIKEMQDQGIPTKYDAKKSQKTLARWNLYCNDVW